MGFLNFIIKFIIIGLIYLILVRIVRAIYIDLKRVDDKNDSIESINFALEVLEIPDTLKIPRGSVYPLNSVLRIGRGEDNEIILNDPFVSNHHSRVFIEDDGIFVEDLTSTNGTFINGRRIDGVSELISQDILKIGRVTFKVIG